MKEKRHVAVVGSIIMDLVVTTPRVPLRGENLLARGFQRGPGGKGANAAVALARLGAQSRLVGRIGDDEFGRAELGALRQEGVRIESVGVDPALGTGAAIIMVDDQGENTILVSIGANAGLSEGFVRQALAPHWATLDALLVNFEIPEAVVAAVIAEANAHDLPVIVDAGPPRQYGPEVWHLATVISPNMLEAEALVGYPVRDDDAATRAARDILEHGPKAVVIKMGACGALLMAGGEEALIDGYQVDVVDTTGAGDAFTSALALAIAEGRDLASAVRWANAAGALAVTRMGAMAAMPRRREVDEFARQRD